MRFDQERITHAGDLVRRWRELRSLSQRDLALAAGVSTRHLSFVETGRANASRKMLLRLGSSLRLNYRQQNQLLNLAGYTAAYPEPELENPSMTPVWDAISQMLNQHEPYPAVVLLPNYDILWSNHGFQKLAAALAGEGVLERHPNIVRLVFAADGLQPFFEDWDTVADALLSRLLEEARITQHTGLWQLLEDFGGLRSELSPSENVPAGAVVLPFTLQKGDLRLRLFSTITSFNSAASVTVQEMRIGSIFPADSESRETYLAHFERKH